MKHKVTRKQTVSHNCFICGEENTAGLKMAFYETDNNDVVGLFEGKKHHNSYPDRMHGGVITAIIDETMGRSIEVLYPGMLGFTTEINVRFKKAVPTGQKLMCVGRIVKDTSRLYTTTGEILGADGTVLVSAEATYIKLDQRRAMGTGDFAGDELYFSKISEDLEWIEY